MRTVTTRLFLLAVLPLGACDTDTAAPPTDATATDTEPADGALLDTTAPDIDEAGPDAALPHPALEGTVEGAFTVRPGVEIATVFGGTPGTAYTLYDAAGTRLLSVRADAFGHAHFSYVPSEHETIDPGNPEDPLAGITGDFVKRARVLTPGEGYVIRDDTLSPAAAVGPFKVLATDDVPDAAFYDAQRLDGVHYGLLGHDGDPDLGLGYIETRDGTLLSAMVRFPDPGFWGDGPYPTVIEYSGYAPSEPYAPDPGSRIATLLGYATVGVNMRGTGCSGGVFDIFSPAQAADAYDIVEVVARQPWVLHGHVGMVGLSYPGISQVYAAATQPPSLAAVTPLSILADPWELLRPGGIYNDGFTRQWLAERDREAASGGQRWTDRRIAWGDETCAAHQELRNQNLDFEIIFKALDTYPDDAYARSIKHLAHRVNVPMYLSGAFQDEQTGGHFTDVLNRFENAPLRRYLLFNGRHADGYSPLALARWWEFLELYVAMRVPRMPDWMRSLGAEEFGATFDSEGLAFEADRFTAFADDDYEGVRAAYEAEPEVRVLFESGGGEEQPGAPVARFAAEFPRWPAPDARTTRLHFQPEGGLAQAAPAGEPAERTFGHDPDAGSRTYLRAGSYDTLARLWDVRWSNFPEGRAVSWETPALDAPMILGGPAWAELHVQSDVADIHLQVTLTELRPDGEEMLIQSGWLRVGHDTLDETMTDGNALQFTYRAEDFDPPEPGEVAVARVPIPSVAHVLRAGSRLRVTVSAPGRNHATWQFAEPTTPNGTHTVLVGPATPSSITLTRLDGTATADALDIPADYPSCVSVRGQPCRPFDGGPASNE